jgi:putative transport protein
MMRSLAMQLLESLNEIPLAGLMLVVTLGFLLGRVTWRGISLGPAGGTLLVAILLGRAGLSFRSLYGEDPRLTLGTLGFALFIYSVGFEAGPRFFASLRGGRALRFALVAAVVNVLALVLAVAAGRLLGLTESVTAGMLSGALTSAPTYAAAAEICSDTAGLAVAFALTYPFGLLGFVLLVQFVPRLRREDLAQDAEVDEEVDAVSRPDREMRRAFEVARDEVVGRPLSELELSRRTGCYISRVHRGMEIFVPQADTVLERGDHVMVKGSVEGLHAFEEHIGPEVFDEDLLDRLPSPRAVRVHAQTVVGKSLRELDLVRRRRTLVTGVLRGDVTLEPSADLRLARDDLVHVSGRRDDVRAVARELGRFERSTTQTDLAVYAGGILLGILLGQVEFRGLGLEFRIGPAVGLLLTGVLLGRFRRIGPFRSRVPAPARQLVRDLGILLFVAETGVFAGESPLGDLRGLLLPTLAAGAVVTLVPVVFALVVGRRLLRLRPVDAWGSVCGGMTSSAALYALRSAADSNEPAISYAAAYAVASVLATLAGQAVVLLL